MRSQVIIVRTVLDHHFAYTVESRKVVNRKRKSRVKTRHHDETEYGYITAPPWEQIAVTGLHATDTRSSS